MLHKKPRLIFLYVFEEGLFQGCAFWFGLDQSVARLMQPVKRFPELVLSGLLQPPLAWLGNGACQGCAAFADNDVTGRRDAAQFQGCIDGAQHAFVNDAETVGQTFDIVQDV